jgi:hypothetical protein
VGFSQRKQLGHRTGGVLLRGVAGDRARQRSNGIVIHALIQRNVCESDRRKRHRRSVDSSVGSHCFGRPVVGAARPRRIAPDQRLHRKREVGCFERSILFGQLPCGCRGGCEVAGIHRVERVVRPELETLRIDRDGKLAVLPRLGKVQGAEVHHRKVILAGAVRRVFADQFTVRFNRLVVVTSHRVPDTRGAQLLALTHPVQTFQRFAPHLRGFLPLSQVVQTGREPRVRSAEVLVVLQRLAVVHKRLFIVLIRG